jgi:hypothetical protein
MLSNGSRVIDHNWNPRQQAGQQVQQQSAATRAHLADRIQPLPPPTKSPKTFNDHAATSYGSEVIGALYPVTAIAIRSGDQRHA